MHSYILLVIMHQNYLLLVLEYGFILTPVCFTDLILSHSTHPSGSLALIRGV
jgi:hypothetical protein